MPDDLDPASETAAPVEPEAVLRPIDKLAPESELSRAVLQKLIDRITMSERQMMKFYSRWQMNEKKMQAHVDLPDYEKLLKQLAQSKGEPPPLLSITVPYAFATIWTIVTYLVHTFAGRKPMFQVGTNKAEAVQGAENMEVVLQADADHMRLIKELFQFFMDGEIYGVSVIRTLWKVDRKFRRSIVSGSVGGSIAPDLPETKYQEKQLRVVHEGNSCKTIDPFMFFPDPRVPMANVAREGEFVFWRTFVGKHFLKKGEMNQDYTWVDGIEDKLPVNENGSEESARNIRTGGTSHAGATRPEQDKAEPFYQMDQGTVELIPSEWGLSDETTVQKWLFTIVNKSRIVQAEPLDLDHDMHPVAAAEAYTVGYGFGQVSLMDMTSPLQDTISWFINSHMHNVRSTMNNSFIFNPAAIEMQDLKNNKAGKLIRLKPAYYGTDVRQVINQLQTHDATSGHVDDVQNFMRMADSLSSVNDNLRGINTLGGRKTATEVRTSGEAGGSRLAAHAKLISAQAIVDLTEQMSLNIQQNMSEDFYMKVVGQEGMEGRIIKTEDLMGDFIYPIHDGTLPIDKIATLDIWKEIFAGVLADPELRTGYDVGKIFEFVAELGGARNISSFKIQNPETMQQNLQAGNSMELTGGGAGLPPELMQLMQLGG